MSSPQLHLVDEAGKPVSPLISAAVEAAFRWAAAEFHYIDTALLAGWAEQIGRTMQAKAESLNSVRRYAYAAMHGRIRDWQKTGASREMAIGLSRDLEEWMGPVYSVQGKVDRTIFFEQLKAHLSARDRYILTLLLEEDASPSRIASALGVSYGAAAKAIQRVKNRIADAFRSVDTGIVSTKDVQLKRAKTLAKTWTL